MVGCQEGERKKRQGWWNGKTRATIKKLKKQTRAWKNMLETKADSDKAEHARRNECRRVVIVREETVMYIH